LKLSTLILRTTFFLIIFNINNIINIRATDPPIQRGATKGLNSVDAEIFKEPQTVRKIRIILGPFEFFNIGRWELSMDSIDPVNEKIKISVIRTGSIKEKIGCQKNTSVRNSYIAIIPLNPNIAPSESRYPYHNTLVIGPSYKANKQPHK